MYRQIIPAGQSLPQQTSNHPAWKSNGWEIIQAIKKLSEKGHKMDEFTREEIAEQIALAKQKHMPAIRKGMAEEVLGAITDVENARVRQQVARQLEANDWSTKQLTEEFQLARERVNICLHAPITDGFGGATRADKFQQLWNEYATRGDKHAIRALSEILEGLDPGDPEARKIVSQIARQSSAMVAELRKTDAIKSADNEAIEAEKYLVRCVEAEKEGLEQLGEYSVWGTGEVYDAMEKAMEYITIREPDSGTSSDSYFETTEGAQND